MICQHFLLYNSYMKLWGKSGLTEQLIQFLSIPRCQPQLGHSRAFSTSPHPHVSFKCKYALALTYKQQLLEWLVSRALGRCGRYTGDRV